MSTYVRTYYKAISTEQANRIKAYINGALRKIDNNQVEKFFTPLLGSLKNGHRYLVFGCNYGPDGGPLRLAKLNAYFQHPDHYDVGELIELKGNMAKPFSLPAEYDYRIEQIIWKFISFLFEDDTVGLQKQETPEPGGEVCTGRAVYGEPDRIEYAAGRSCDQASVVCQTEGIRKPEVQLSLRNGQVREASW